MKKQIASRQIKLDLSIEAFNVAIDQWAIDEKQKTRDKWYAYMLSKLANYASEESKGNYTNIDIAATRIKSAYKKKNTQKTHANKQRQDSHLQRKNIILVNGF